MANSVKNKKAEMPRESPRVTVLRWLEQAIGSGELPPGREIPSERAIAMMLGVAPNTAAAAMDEAEERGLVARRRPGGRKRYVRSAHGGDSLASSTVYVLARPGRFTDIATAPSWSDGFLALDIVRHFSNAGRHVSLVNAGTLSPGDFDALFAAPPAGLAVKDSVYGDPLAMRALERCREAGIPSVAYGNAPELRGYDRVYSNHRAGSRDLTRWLLARGRTRIVPFFPFAPTRFWEHERIAGYEEAMREAGLEPAPCVVFGSASVSAEQTAENFRLNAALALSALVALRRDGATPDALLCLNDDWAKPALAAIHDLGLAPNRDILVAGYDNMARGAGFDAFCPLRPDVTVDKHNERSAEDIAELLLARMAGTLPPEPQARIHVHEIVEVEASANVHK